MKTILKITLVILTMSLIACNNEESIQVVKMRINHFQQPVNHNEWFSGLSYIYQEGESIGGSSWSELENSISGFDYELGYIYDIEVNKETIENPGMDENGIKYSLKKIVSKTKVPLDTKFNITLSRKFSSGFEAYISKNELSEYKLMLQTKVDCGELFNTLEENLLNKRGLIGEFTHVDKQTIKLIKLEVTD